MNQLKLRIMISAFKIRIGRGETFEDVAGSYPALTGAEIESIRKALEA